MFRWGLALAVGVGVGFYAHNVGKDLALEQVKELNERLTEEIEASAKLRSEIAGLQAALGAERDKVDMWRARYEKDVPTEIGMPILAAVRARLEAGVTPERIATVVSIARDDVACESLGESKRFSVNNEISWGANDSVTFANGMITITGDGTAARNANGRPEAWFDADAPVTVNFAHLGGEVSQVTGLLPLHNSMAIGDVEYRFTAVAGGRSFVRVTGQKCPIS